MSAPRILAFAGSLKKASLNHRLVQIAAEGARAAGADVTLIRLSDFPLPLFDEDLEAASGMPKPAAELKQLFLDHQGLLIASPEYNSSVSAVLKNALDWVSRASAGQPALSAFRGKTAAILSASPGWMGGLRGLVHLRAILGNVGVLMVPDQATISRAHEGFAENGSLKDPAMQTATLNVGKVLAQTLLKS